MKRFLIFLLLAACACSRVPDLLNEGEDVSVSLHLVTSDGSSVVCGDAGQEYTKGDGTALSSESDAVEDVVRNFWVAQYDGTADDAPLLGEAKYFPEGGNDEQVQVVASDSDNRIVVIANTFDPAMSFPQGSTFGDLKKKLRTVADNESFLSVSGEDKYLVFSGSVVGMIKEGESFSCELKRNVAKSHIRIVNSSSDVVIRSWQLRSVPSVCHYYTNYELPEKYPAAGDFTGIDYPLVTPQEPLGQNASYDYTVYLPANKCGIRSEVTAEAYKNLYAPREATYLQVNAESGGNPLVYRFYLGANMTADFNVLPNTTYSYVFEIKSRGDGEYDSRIDEVCLRDFANANDELANCYVINPMEVNGILRRFRIPVKRVDEFWGGRGYENVPENTLGADAEWKVELLASNFDNSAGNLTFTKSDGAGSYDPNTAELQYFEFTVKPDTRGSAIVGLRKGDGPILWSWHLWITDYAPEEAFSNTPQDGVYSYPVEGGTVHRYEGSIWDNGEYAGRFIMDRNLGALNVSDYANGTGSLYYQFGRKDPIFGNRSYGFDRFGSESYTDIVSQAPDDPVAAIKYSIHNPLKYIYTPDWGAWTTGNKYNPSIPDETMLWMDPFTSSKAYFSLACDKSVFDPCPPGYCVPKADVWSDFTSQAGEFPTTNVDPSDYMLRGFEYFDGAYGGKGCLYWPYPETGNADNVPPDPVYYPAAGIIQTSTGAVGSLDNVYVMSANHYDGRSYYMLYASSQELSPSRGDIGMNLASAVRCITSRDADR